MGLGLFRSARAHLVCSSRPKTLRSPSWGQTPKRSQRLPLHRAQIWGRALIYYFTEATDYRLARKAVARAALDLYGAEAARVAHLVMDECAFPGSTNASAPSCGR